MTPYTKTNRLFAPENRQKIQIFLSSLAPILVGLGIVTEAEAEQWLILAGIVIQAAAGLINLVNLRGALTVWTVLRGIIYTAATGAAPALTWLGYIDEATAATALHFLSLALTALSAGVAIFTSGKQQAAGVLEEQDGAEG